MSTGALAASQANGLGAFANVGALLDQPPGSQQSNQPQSARTYGSDRISVGAPGEAPPLLPTMPPVAPGDAKADSIVGSQVTGYGAIALLGISIAVLAAFLLHVILEGRSTRQKIMRDLKREDFEHKIRTAVLEKKEPTRDWVRDLEKLDVDPFVTDRMTAHYADLWNTFAEAQDALEAAKAAPLAVLFTKRETALTKLTDFGIPVIPDGAAEHIAGRAVQRMRLDRNAHSSNGIPWHAAVAAATHVHGFLEKKKDAGDIDGDDARLSQKQIQLFIDRSVGIEPTEQERFDARASRAEARNDEFHDKLTNLHNQALRKLIAKPAGPR